MDGIQDLEKLEATNWEKLIQDLGSRRKLTVVAKTLAVEKPYNDDDD